uniref:Zinc finger CW-type and PWWP domain containing 1 n=1 Tax=Cebus imitator TaxID=2715852 RepID=A0A2K5SG73_CEBIM
MMTTLQNKEECGKGPKRIFAPPAQKSYNLIPFSPNSPKKETLGISSPETEARISLPKARLKKEEKATTNNASSRGQEKKRKAQNNKQAEKKEKEKSSLTNAEFEEIVQIVLQKSLQERLGTGSGLDFAETSCAQPIVSTQSDEEPGITASATDTDNADGEEVPHTQEISVSWEGEAVPEIRTSKLGQSDPAPSEKKSSRLSLSKRKKEAGDEKVEKTQSGHELRQKDQLEKTVQDHSQIRDQQKGEISGFDQCLVWVQCSFPNCGKWRRLCGNVDPSVLPDNWSCDQNTDMEYNRCDIPEETWTGLESDVAYASYVPGSIIWAKQYGYPWWPGMIESDPDLGEYFLFTSHLDSLPSKYHVTFFGETVSRAWIPVNMLKNFQELSLEPSGMERVNLFGFWSRFNGSNSNGERKDLQLSGFNSPGSCLDKKEEKEEELEKEGKQMALRKNLKLPRARPWQPAFQREKKLEQCRTWAHQHMRGPAPQLQKKSPDPGNP